MTNEAQVSMDGSPAVSVLFNTQQGQLMGGDTISYGPFGEIKWQVGPDKEVGINGTTIEDVLGVCKARLEGFQRGPFACGENARAIDGIGEALSALGERTAKRRSEGVEGTNQQHAG